MTGRLGCRSALPRSPGNKAKAFQHLEAGVKATHFSLLSRIVLKLSWPNIKHA